MEAADFSETLVAIDPPARYHITEESSYNFHDENHWSLKIPKFIWSLRTWSGLTCLRPFPLRGKYV